ncbi:MerR family transcriptional regulator [Campylobacter geochelonis]|uniref:MerR family transcriptional regulator n=1 Tax=Campylobacter geochelonis TaxID=1780362 RepID=UPI0007707BE2|nr:MerR family transcriptional regulator [Campylobacter geochelonis]CZE47196.1 transcriptional regulator%2C MerR family protein [Campylobacter geochelonis]
MQDKTNSSAPTHYKMSELIELTETPKSTILFYIKEGLLPKPTKVKTNVHSYGVDTVKMLKFIKYTQTYFNFSIKELKTLVLRDDFSFENCYESLLNSLDIFMGAGFKKEVSKEKIEDELNISKSELEGFIKDGYILSRDGNLTQKELEILSIIKKAKNSEIGFDIVKIYLEFALNLAKIEGEIAKEALEKSSDKNELYRLILDITLTLKPYIFNYQTFNIYKKDIK